MSDDPSPTIRDPFPPASPAPLAPAVEPVRPLTPAPAPRKSSSGLWLNVLLIVAAAVAIGGVSFALGRSTAPVTTAAAARGGFGNGQFGGNGPARSFDPNASFPAGGFGGNGAAVFGGRGANVGVSGTVDSVTADSITIKTANGQTVTLSLDGQTTYHESTAGTAADVTPGATVTVRVGGLGGGLGQGGAAASGTPNLTATDVTVGK